MQRAHLYKNKNGLVCTLCWWQVLLLIMAESGVKAMTGSGLVASNKICFALADDAFQVSGCLLHLSLA